MHTKTVDVTIASGQTVSPEFEITDGFDLVGIYKPATMTSTTLTFQAAAVSGGTFGAIIDSAGVTVTKTISTTLAQYLSIPPIEFAGVRYGKIVAGTAEAAARVLTLQMRRIN